MMLLFCWGLAVLEVSSSVTQMQTSATLEDTAWLYSRFPQKQGQPTTPHLSTP